MKDLFRCFKNSYFLYSFKKDPVAITCFLILLFLFLISFLAPILAPMNPYDVKSLDLMNSEMPPMWIEGGTSEFILGTDIQGRDLLSTMMYGMRISILIGIGAVFLQAFLGLILGLIAGYYGKWIDSFLMRMADIQLSFSTLMVAIFVTAIFKVTFGLEKYEEFAVPILILVIGISEWPQYARTVRAAVLAEKNKEYVEAARVIGLRPMRIILRHLFPNTLSSVLVLSTVQIANSIMSEAFLSFVGLGMPVTRPSLGSLINTGFEYIFSGSWWITLFPGIILVLLILVINLLGDWLRDVLNPKLYKH